jgi:hypothetical protein
MGQFDALATIRQLGLLPSGRPLGHYPSDTLLSEFYSAIGV